MLVLDGGYTLSEAEREAFRTQAAAEGKSLSRWLRDAGRTQLADLERRPLRTVDDLRRFFDALPDQEGGVEPDWDAHLRVIDDSRRRGASST
jgi:hypothetical protein